MKRILSVCFLLAILLGLSSAARAQSAYPYAFELPNDSTTGTTQFTLTKINSSGNAVIMATTDTNGYIGVCVDNCGKTGSSWIAFEGPVPIVMENAATPLHYVAIGSTTGGEGHDTGATTYPTSGGDVIGRIQTAATSGNAAIVMLDPESVVSNSSGALAVSIVSKTASYTSVSGDWTNGCSNWLVFSLTAIGQALTLPSTAPTAGTCIVVQDLSVPYNLQIITSGSTTLDGKAFSASGSSQFAIGPYGPNSITIESDGSNYHSNFGSAPLQLTGSTTNGFVFVPLDAYPTSTQTSGLQAANQPWLTRFILREGVMVNKLAIGVGTGVASSTGDWGIYDASLNLLVHTGSQSTVSSSTTTSASAAAPIYLPPGIYYQATCDTSTSVAFIGIAFGGVYFAQAYGSGTSGVGPTSSCTAGVLPSTLASVTNNTSPGSVPLMLVGP